MIEIKDEFMNKTAAAAIRKATGLEVSARVKKAEMSPPMPGFDEESWSLYWIMTKVESDGNTFYPDTGSCTTLEDAVDQTLKMIDRAILEFGTIELKTWKEIEDFFGETLKNRDAFEMGIKTGIERITPTKVRLLKAIGSSPRKAGGKEDILKRVNEIDLEELREIMEKAKQEGMDT